MNEIATDILEDEILRRWSMALASVGIKEYIQSIY